MPGSLQSKGDGEYPFSAPFTGLNVSLPSILLPPSAQDYQVSPSFSIVRGSICAPWPYATTLFGKTLASNEYLIFATPSGYVATNLALYQIQGLGPTSTGWQLVQLETFDAGMFTDSGISIPQWPFVEANGCLYFSCGLGIYRYSPSNGLQAWSVAFYPQFMTIFQQRMLCVGAYAVGENVTPGTPSGTQGSGGSLPDGTYYAVITAVFPSGTEGPPSAEGTVTVSGGGGTASIAWAWTAVTGASSYNVYIGTATGEENAVYSTSTNSYTLDSYTAGTASPPVMPPMSPVTVAWSTVSDFSSTSVGSFNSNPNTTSGVVGGYDVLTNYSQGVPSGLIGLGHSEYVLMSQGIVEIDPSQNGTSAFTLYNYWQQTIPVGAIPGTVAQFGPISAFVSPDNVNIWVPGQQTQIGTPVMPIIRNIFRNANFTGAQTAFNPQSAPGYPIWPQFCNSSFYTIYNELHYGITFFINGIPPQQASPPYPDQQGSASWFGLLLDYNFASQSWSQQIIPPVFSPLYQVNGPPCLASGEPLPGPPYLPYQGLLLGATVPSGGSPAPQAGWIAIATDVFNQLAWSGIQCQGLESSPQPCQVGFPQTPISSGHRPANRRVRIEYSMDEFSCGSATSPVNLTVSIQGTITQNTGAINGAGVATSTIQTISKTIQVQPPGTIAVASGNPVVPFLTATAYADMILSCENPQISLSWTDPSSHQRLMIHRVTLQTNDTKGAMQ